MPYTDSLLSSGERILRHERQHWFMLVWDTRWALLAVLLALLGLVARAVIGGEGVLLTLLGYLVLILFVGGLAYMVWGWFEYVSQEYVVTSRRIIHAEGVINKKASDSSLEMINDAVLTESVFGRLFGFGDLEILTASESGIDNLQMLRDAKGFKKSMLDAKHELEIELARPTTPPLRAGSTPPVREPLPGAPAPIIAPGAPAAPPSAAASPVAPSDEGAPASPGVSVAALQTAPAAPAAAPASRPPAAMSAEEVTEAIDRLGDLQSRGVITPEEFEAKKRELLARL
jgi:hypothetical protein